MMWWTIKRQMPMYQQACEDGEKKLALLRAVRSRVTSCWGTAPSCTINSALVISRKSRLKELSRFGLGVGVGGGGERENAGNLGAAPLGGMP